MEMITVIKADLLDKIRANREEHIRLYNEAVINYQADLIAKVSAKLDEIRESNDITKVSLSVALPVPEQHTDDYDSVIAMLEWEQKETIELDQGYFDQYVLNKWRWANQFLANTASYSNAGRAH